MRNFLTDIVNNKRIEVEKNKSLYQKKIMSDIKNMPDDSKNEFRNRLRKTDNINCIGEIKKHSPSKGLIRKDFNPIEIANLYAQLDVAAISVLTDEHYFQGKLEYIKQVKNVSSIPVLRKDFIIDPYQIYEAKAFGSNAILLIVKLLSIEQLKEFIQIAHQLNLDCLIEVHNEHEIQQALNAGGIIIGVNNRDLETFKTDINVSLELIKHIPRSCIKVSESAIKTNNDIKKIDAAGFDSVLIGEQFMRSDDIKKTYQELFFGK